MSDKQRTEPNIVDDVIDNIMRGSVRSLHDAVREKCFSRGLSDAKLCHYDVTCDDTNNPPYVQDMGVVHILLVATVGETVFEQNCALYLSDVAHLGERYRDVLLDRVGCFLRQEIPFR